MRIAILTLPLHTNYGGILQAYALQTVLQRMGHEVLLIEKERDLHKSRFRLMLSYGKYLVKRYLLREDITYTPLEQLNAERRVREQHMQHFIHSHIATYRIKRLEEVKAEDFDAIVVGSDQVWRHQYFTRLYDSPIGNAYLKFCTKAPIKRIAYAASFGTDEWEYSARETEECARLLQQFDSISVREKSAIGLCERKLHRADARLVLDPTLLLDKEDYIALVHQAATKRSPGNLMCYILDNNDEKQGLINRVAHERGLTPFNASSKVEDPYATLEESIQPPVEAWLQAFVDAEFVITDSFHACVFSIIFGKPFVVVGNRERGLSRFTSLMEMFGVTGNLLHAATDYDSHSSYGIPKTTGELYRRARQQSLEFLSNAFR